MQRNPHIYRKEGEVTERDSMLNHLRQSQVCLAALTIVGRAATINEGRKQLADLIMTLDDVECSGLLFGLTEMLAMELMAKAESVETFHSALEKSGTLLSIAIAELEEQAGK